MAGFGWDDIKVFAVGSEFQVNTYVLGNQNRPAVAAEPGGRAVMVWEGRNGQDGSETGVFGRVVYDDGYLSGGKIRLNTTTG
mgnify:CR=1 FL=1